MTPPKRDEEMGLETIYSAIKNHTALSFAELKLKAQKDAHNMDYYTFMRDVYSGKDNPTIEECEQNSLMQFINEYLTCCKIYSGWVKCGKIFILDRRERLIMALYENDGTNHKSIVHYNPLGVDLIEISINNRYFFEDVDEGVYELSRDPEGLIKELDKQIRYEKV